MSLPTDSSHENDLKEISTDILSDCPSIDESDYEDIDSEISSDEDIDILLSDETLKPSNSSNITAAISEEWTENDFTPKLEEFLGTSGPTFQIQDPSNISEFLELFFGNDFFDILIYQTNLYYSQTKHNYKVSNNDLKWKDITIVDLKKFLGLIILMGQVKKSCWKDYWSINILICTPIFSQIMSRKKFELIWTFLHFNDNSLVKPSEDRIFKIKPILNHFISKFQKFYKPKQQLSLDEGMVPWRGRLLFRTYNPSKIIKYGVLVRMVCESDTGYICNLKIYTGEGLKLEETILSILQPYLGLWYHIYQDNYYNSVFITETLLENNFRICGTIREKRGIPKDLILKSKTLKKDDMIFLRKNDIIIVIWKNKRVVRMISTIHNSSKKYTGKKDKSTKQDILKPTCVIDYNKHMKGVDRADQYLNSFSILKKTIKWYKKVALYLIKCGLFNTFRLYQTVNKDNSKTLTYKEFLVEVATLWISEQPSNNFALNNLTSTNNFENTHHNDFIFHLPKEDNLHELKRLSPTPKKKYPTRICKLCSTKEKRKETRYICKECNVSLHKGRCYN